MLYMTVAYGQLLGQPLGLYNLLQLQPPGIQALLTSCLVLLTRRCPAICPSPPVCQPCEREEAAEESRSAAATTTWGGREEGRGEGGEEGRRRGGKGGREEVSNCWKLVILCKNISGGS